MPLENALTLFNQLFGFFISSATLKSHSVASAINYSIIMVPLLNVFCLFICLYYTWHLRLFQFPNHHCSFTHLSTHLIIYLSLIMT